MNFVENIVSKDQWSGDNGDTDRINQHIAWSALSILRDKVQGPFSVLDLHSQLVWSSLLLRPPCRWQKLSLHVPVGTEDRNVEVVLDIGHNPAAIAALTKRIEMDYADKPVRVVYAMSRDKDVRACMEIILRVVGKDRIYFAEVGYHVCVVYFVYRIA